MNELYCYVTEPPTLDYDRERSPFYEGLKIGATLYVPTGCVATYKSSDWGEVFDNIIEME